MNWKFTPSWMIRLAGSALFALLMPQSHLVAADAFVGPNDDLQKALNQAQPGNTITLQAGTVFTGHYTLAFNPGPQIITIQSSAMSSLPGPGGRVNPSQAQYMPKLVTPDGNPVLVIAAAPNSAPPAYYRIQGIEFSPVPGFPYLSYDLIQVGTGGEQSLGALPHNIDFDRDYIHGDPNSGGKRGIALNGGYTTIENCYLSAFTGVGVDTQAIEGWNGPGPYRILNNYLEAGSETVAFGGATPALVGNIPSDILISHNDFYKPLSWQATPILVKNHLELKFARRVTIDSNTFINNWGPQQGFSLVFSMRTEGGAVYWGEISDVTVTNNLIRHSGAGIWFLGHDRTAPDASSGRARNFLIQNNRFEDISKASVGYGSGGSLFEINDGVDNVTIDHNTGLQDGWVEVYAGVPSRVYATNNVFNIGAGIQGDSGGGPGHAPGTDTLEFWNPQGNFLNNALIGGKPPYPYPPDPPYPGGPTYPGNNTYNVPDEASAPAGLGANLSAPVGFPTGWLYLVNRNSGKCLDTPNWSGSNYGLNPGLAMMQYTCNNGTGQRFQFTPYQGGYFITTQVSGMTVDVAGASTQPGGYLCTWNFFGGTNETYTLGFPAAGYYTFSPRNSTGQTVDVGGASTDDGGQIVQWPYFSGYNEQWSLVPAH